MLEVTKKIEFDMGHRLPKYEGKCRHLHGHRYVLLVTVKGKTQEDGSDEGMVIDFAKLKAAMSEVVEGLDHRMMLSINDPIIQGYYQHSSEDYDKDRMERDGILIVDFVPTAENIAVWIWRKLLVKLLKSEMSVTKVQLYETPTSVVEVS